MPFTVITLTSVPNSLRGELTKWMQEIAVGVYVGNFNSRVREELWKHVCENVKKGEATISYAVRNEIGYTFDSYQTKQEVVELDGIPLVRYPVHQKVDVSEEKYGFSNAFHSHIRHRMEKKGSQGGPKNVSTMQTAEENEKSSAFGYVLLDLETTGLDAEKNRIIEIGALKVQGECKEEFHRLLWMEEELPQFISDLTGITWQMLDLEGSDRKTSMMELADFIGELPLVGYNVKFDLKFLEAEFCRLGLDWKAKGYVDIMALVKREKMFLDNYKFGNVLSSYGIQVTVQHRALEDVKLLGQLITKLKEFETAVRRKG